MICPKCGSENVDVQLIQENQGRTIKTKTKTKNTTRKGHGCLWWIFIGSWWWIIDLFLWCFAFLPRLIIHLKSGRKEKSKTISETTSNEKVHTVYRTMCLCHNCGYHWEK